MQHAEPVPDSCIKKPHEEVNYMPMHAVRKSSKTTTKICVVFDASATSSSGTSLNEQCMIGPTVHAPMLDVLLRFRRYKVALATDVSQMYRAMLLPESQWDFAPIHLAKRLDEGFKGLSNEQTDLWGLSVAFRHKYGCKM